MRKRFTRTVAAGAAIAVLSAAVAGAQEPPPDKSGGTRPVRLTLLNSDTTLVGVPAVKRFVERVRALSRGALTIKVRPQNDGRAAYERRIVRDVQANKAQLAWVGTRVWDTLGVNTFRALHAPMLVDSYALQGAVLRSDLPEQMLAGLAGRGVVGLAVLGDNLRYPAGVDRPLRGPDDYKGITFQSITSATQAAAVRALGARPSHLGWAELVTALKSSRVDGFEIDLKSYEGNSYAALAPFLTVNVALWPRTAVLIANAAALGKLSGQQRRWIRQAAKEAATYSLTTFGEDQPLLSYLCRHGARVATASPAQLAGLRKAFAPVYASLRGDKATAAMLGKIAALERRVKPRPLTIPKGCGAPNPSNPAPDPGATFPEGLYRFTRAEADVRRLWPDVDDDNLRLLTGTFTVGFAKGRLEFIVSAGGVPGCRRGEGAYKANGQFVTTSWTTFHGCPLLPSALPTPPLKLGWSSDDKVLRFRVTQPAGRIDFVHWESNPFVRIR